MNLLTHVTGTHRRSVIATLRSSRRLERRPPGQEIQTDIVNKIINDAVDQLSEKFKIVIVLRDIQGLSYEDISEIINVPIGTVKSRINRARLQLQVELKHLKK